MNEDTLMRWVLLGLLTAALLVAAVVRRSREKEPPRRRARRRTARFGVVGRNAASSTSETEAPELDPFEVLRVQLRLGALAEEVRALERNGNLYARGHHLKATQAAYDALLIEACVLAGIATAPGSRSTLPQDELERFREEVELASRGWSW